MHPVIPKMRTFGYFPLIDPYLPTNATNFTISMSSTPI